jgi:hypothetical protein
MASAKETRALPNVRVDFVHLSTEVEHETFILKFA